MNDTTLPTVSPSIQYKDCPTAIKWLEDVLGFTKEMIAIKENGMIQHSELRFRNGFVTVSSTDENGLNWQGEEPGTIDISLTASDKNEVEIVYDRVKDSGATIVKDFQYSDFGQYGGSWGFTCADPEGHRWSIGTYQPGVSKNK